MLGLFTSILLTLKFKMILIIGELNYLTQLIYT